MPAMMTTESIPGLDTELPPVVVGCDPGPCHCAFATVVREGCGTRLRLVDVSYAPVARMLDDLYLGFTTAEGPEPRATVIEKMAFRFGATPGATTFDTCRNSGVVLARAARAGHKAAYMLSPSDWRVAFGGSATLSDAGTRARIVELFGGEADAFVAKRAKEIKKSLGLDKPVGSHLRDAVGIAAAAFLMARRGAAMCERAVWREVARNG